MAIGEKRPVLMEDDRSAPGGVAALGEDGKVPKEQLPDDFIPKNVATLGEDGKLEESQRPDIDANPTESSNNPVKSGGVFSALQQKSNTNILDNWYFVGGGSQQGGGQFPINQWGETEYTNTTGTSMYTFDRWMLRNGSMRIEDDGIVITDMSPGQTTNRYRVLHRIDANYIEKDRLYTLSLLTKSQLNDSTIDISFGGKVLEKTVQENTNGFISISCRIPDTSAETVGIRINLLPNESIKIVAAKFELGGTQTLAHQDADGRWVLNDPPPNYALELAKCQRYQYNPFHGGKSTWVHLGLGIKTGEKVAQIEIPVPVSPRTNPTVAYFSNLYLRPASKESYIPVIDVSASSNLTSAGTIWINCEVASDLAYETYMLTARENSATLLLDMNL